MKCYLYTIWHASEELEFNLVFRRPPSYAELIRRLPNNFRRVLSTDREEAKFEIDTMGQLGAHCGSFPLFKNNPTGRERNKDGFDFQKNLIGRITIQPITFVANILAR